MRASLALVAAWLAATEAGFTPATPGTAADIIVTDKNTLNSTSPRNKIGYQERRGLSTASLFDKRGTGNPNVQFQLYNNAEGDHTIYVYINGKTGQDQHSVFLNPNGQYYTPQALSGQQNTRIDPSQITIAVSKSSGGGRSEVDINLPDYLSSGRVWYSMDEELQFQVNGQGGTTNIVQPTTSNPKDPSAGTEWGFVEFTNNNNSLFINPTAVDFVGLPSSIVVKDYHGQSHATGYIYKQGSQKICSSLSSKAQSEKQPWDQLCVTDNHGKIVRVLSPNLYLTGYDTSSFQNYYKDYVNKVWSRFSSETLNIDTQGGFGTSSCRVSNNQMHCSSDHVVYNKPNAMDIFGCNSGPFQADDTDAHGANRARLCAAFNRNTLLLNDGNNQPTANSESYQAGPANWYANYVHQQSYMNRTYAFSFDDVAKTGEADQSGSLNVASPQWVFLALGGY